ncbi:hypothetical protein J6590_040040, partial [Homalodisca vitripennis]
MILFNVKLPSIFCLHHEYGTEEVIILIRESGPFDRDYTAKQSEDATGRIVQQRN